MSRWAENGAHGVGAGAGVLRSAGRVMAYRARRFRLVSRAMASGRGRGKQQNNDQKRFALLDLGFPAGEDFCRELLLTPDFNLSTLSPFAKGESKSGAASAIARRIAEGEQDPEVLVLAYCQQPRQWLSIRAAKSSSLPEQSSAKDFL